MLANFHGDITVKIRNTMQLQTNVIAPGARVVRGSEKNKSTIVVFSKLNDRLWTL